MKDEAFSLWQLLPDFKEIFVGHIQSAEGLTALFVLILICVFVISMSYALYKCISAMDHIKFYKDLLKNVTQDQLASCQRALTQQALAYKKDKYGKLWKEFDETLVFSPEGSRVFNTLDAAHFFNTRSLSKGLIENRLLAAVPSFLTAIGVIGTFAGLTLGLSTLEIEQNAGVDVLRQGIGNMISGASIAFMTSVWGVTLSVLFNLSEKIMERYIRKEVLLLQNRIDYLYPRINPEQSLVKIVDYNRVSTETLQGLAEKIGDRLQEAIIHSTETIRTGLEESLNKIMAPAIQSLVDNAHQGSEQALESLLNRFLDGVGEAGNVQRQMMEDTTKEVQTTILDLGKQMSGFLVSLEKQNMNTREESQARQELLTRQLQELEKQQEERQQEIGEAFKIMIDDLVDKLQTHHQQTESRDMARTAAFERILQDMIAKSNQAVKAISEEVASQIEKEKELHGNKYQALSDQVEGFKQTQADLTKGIESMISLQYDESELIRQGLSELLERFQQVAEANRTAGKELNDSTKQMQGVSNQLGLFAVTLKQITEKLSADIGKAAELTADLSEENYMVSKDMQKTLDGYQALIKTMDDVVTRLHGATESAERGFGHLDEFKESMKSHAEELDEHIRRLLINYADQVRSQTIERLNTWNEQTNDYISLMTSAMRVLNDVVDGIENKIGGHA